MTTQLLIAFRAVCTIKGWYISAFEQPFFTSYTGNHGDATEEVVSYFYVDKAIVADQSAAINYLPKCIGYLNQHMSLVTAVNPDCKTANAGLG